MNQDLIKPKNTRNKLTAVDAIRRYILDDRGHTKLTAKQEEIYHRLKGAHAMLIKMKSIVDSVPVLMRRFDISEVQAFRDLKNAQKLFGDVMKADKEGIRYITYQHQLKALEMARKKGDYDGMSKAVKNVIKLFNLDKDDPDIPDYSKLEPNVYPIIINEQIEKTLDALLKSNPTLNLSRLYDQAETIELENKADARSKEE